MAALNRLNAGVRRAGLGLGLGAALVLALAGCGSGAGDGNALPSPLDPVEPTGATSSTSSASSSPSDPGPPTSSPSASGSPSDPDSSSTTTPTVAPQQQEIADFEANVDPRWSFHDTDASAYYTSPWFDGVGKLMIPFGCSSAPFYSSDSRCPGDQGFHHGVDMALPCGVELRAAVDGTTAEGDLGEAYGPHAFVLRTASADLVIGHVSETLVEPGQQVQAGQAIAINGAEGAPDGCHLHLEKRSVGGGLASAVDSQDDLQLTRVG